MPRMARFVMPGHPHHVTQRGSRRQRTFFTDADYEGYLELLHDAKKGAGVDIWAWCLMPNHIHLVAVPKHECSLAKMLRIAHHRHALRVNAEHGWRGHLWQERFHSCVMDEAHLMAAVRYVELNPVRAGLCRRPDQWRWSSVHAHLARHDDAITSVLPMMSRVSDWPRYLSMDVPPDMLDALRCHSNTGRPAGSADFVAALEKASGRILRPRKSGPGPAS